MGNKYISGVFVSLYMCVCVYTSIATRILFTSREASARACAEDIEIVKIAYLLIGGRFRGRDIMRAGLDVAVS